MELQAVKLSCTCCPATAYGCWTWAGELTYRVNGVKRMCRTVPQPVSEEHMRVILSSVEQFYSLPVAGEDNPRTPVVALTA